MSQMIEKPLATHCLVLSSNKSPIKLTHVRVCGFLIDVSIFSLNIQHNATTSRAFIHKIPSLTKYKLLIIGMATITIIMNKTISINVHQSVHFFHICNFSLQINLRFNFFPHEIHNFPPKCPNVHFLCSI